MVPTRPAAEPYSSRQSTITKHNTHTAKRSPKWASRSPSILQNGLAARAACHCRPTRTIYCPAWNGNCCAASSCSAQSPWRSPSLFTGSVTDLAFSDWPFLSMSHTLLKLTFVYFILVHNYVRFLLLRHFSPLRVYSLPPRYRYTTEKSRPLHVSSFSATSYRSRAESASASFAPASSAAAIASFRSFFIRLMPKPPA
jgi:hypothetical protein